MRYFKKYSVFLLCFLFFNVCVDQFTKIEAEQRYLVWQHDTNLKEYGGRREHMFSLGDMGAILNQDAWFFNFNFCYVRNQGAAWGTLSDLDDHIRVPFFYLVSLIAFLVIGFYFKNTPREHTCIRFALTLMLSGAVGNFLDRVRLGYVIDFLDVSWVIPFPWPIHINIDMFTGSWSGWNRVISMNGWYYDFPKFNWADSVITIGVCCLMIDMLFLEPRRMRALGRA